MKLALKQKQIIIGVVVVLVVIVAVVLGVLITNKSNGKSTPTTIPTTIPTTTPTTIPTTTSTQPTTLLPAQPNNNYVNIGLSTESNTECYKIKSKLLPLKNIVLNSIFTQTRYPQMKFYWDDIELTAYVYGIIVNNDDFTKSKYIITFPYQYELDKLIGKNENVPIQGVNYISNGFNYGFSYRTWSSGETSEVNGYMILKPVQTLDLETYNLTVCYAKSGWASIPVPDVLLGIYVKYNSNIVEAIKNDLNDLN